MRTILLVTVLLITAYPSTFAYAQGACGTLDKKACFIAAVKPLKSANISESQAIDTYNKLALLCEMNNKKSCTIAAEVARDVIGDTKLELKLYANECSKGLPQYCGAAALLTKEPNSKTYDLSAARQFAKQGCYSNDAYLCYLQGLLYRRSSTETIELQNAELAQKGYYLACKHGKGIKHLTESLRAYACYSAYNMGGNDYEYNPNEAYRMFGIKESCFMGDLENCRRAIYGLYYGRMGFERHIEEAGLLAEHLCVQGHADYCGQASKIWRESGQNDRAILFSELLCEKYPSGDNCAMIFHTAHEIYGKDASETIGAATEACNNESGDACWYLAARSGGYERGSTDDVYIKACRYGVDEICDYLKEMNVYFAVKDENKAIRRRQAQARKEAKAYNEALAAQKRESLRSAPTSAQYSAAGEAYWSNWKPSYCSNYTKGMYTSKSECAN